MTRGAVFVLPTTIQGQQGPVAAWMSTAGWATAARRVLGEAWIVGPAGFLDIEDLRQRGSNPALTAPHSRRWTRSLPVPVKTAVKDVRQWQRARSFRTVPSGPWVNRNIAFVWQRHELFHDAGIALAEAIGARSVLFVPATHVWEAAQWGVKRVGWGRALERLAESPALRRADLVACGSEDVVVQVRRLGVPAERIVVTPTGVDLELFTGEAQRDAMRERLGLADRFVVGWVGSFRKFHALELAVDAVAMTDESALLFVGDGPERWRIERYASDRGVEAVFTGTVPHVDLPAYLAAMDVGLVLASNESAFHYSPLKLGEYLASGLASIVPRVPQLEGRLQHGVNAALVPRGDRDALVQALQWLKDEPNTRACIGSAAKEIAAVHWSWDNAVHKVLAALSRSSR